MTKKGNNNKLKLKQIRLNTTLNILLYWLIKDKC